MAGSPTPPLSRERELLEHPVIPPLAPLSKRYRHEMGRISKGGVDMRVGAEVIKFEGDWGNNMRFMTPYDWSIWGWEFVCINYSCGDEYFLRKAAIS